MKLLEEIIGRTISDINLSTIFFEPPLRIMEIETKIPNEMSVFWSNYKTKLQTLGDGERQGRLVCCSPWGCKESDRTQQLNNNDKTKMVLLQRSLLPTTQLDTSFFVSRGIQLLNLSSMTFHSHF